MTDDDRDIVLHALDAAIEEGENTTGSIIGAYIQFDDGENESQDPDAVWEWGGYQYDTKDRQVGRFAKRDDLMVIAKNRFPPAVWDRIKQVMDNGDNWDLLVEIEHDRK